MTDTALPDGFVLDDPQMKRRGTILPVAEYEDGSASLAVPGFIHDPIAAFSQLLYRGYRAGSQDEEGVALATQAAGGAMAGGALAARPAASLGAGGIMPRQVLSWFQRSGVPVEKTQQASTGTVYLRARDPNASQSATGSRFEVRIPPEDGHGGRVLPRDVKPGNYFDTTPEAPRKQFDRIMAPRVNEGGGMYSEWDNLEAALKWRTSRAPNGQWLIRPDQAPRSIEKQSRNPGKAAQPETISPEQLKLLSGGLPPGFILDDDMSHDDVRRWIEGAH